MLNGCFFHSTFNIPHSTFKPWCERGDSNPHGFGPLAPKTSASANSATFAAGNLFFGAPTRTRTWNQQIKSLLLYQLSYGGAGSYLTAAVEEVFRLRGGGF